MKSKNSKPNTRRPTPTPANSNGSGGPPPEVAAAAAAMDAEISASAGGDGPKAETIMGGGKSKENIGKPDYDSEGAPLTRKPGETRGRKTKAELAAEAKAAAEAAASAPPDPMLVALFGQATDLLLQYAASQKWAAPTSAVLNKDNKLEYSTEAWREQVAACQMALAKKYGGDFVTQWTAEITLGVLILPWAVQNILAALKRAREEKRLEAERARTAGRRESTGSTVVSPFPVVTAGHGDRGNVGLRQDDANAGANGQGAAASNPS
jgi:hypothetical protein